MARWCETKNTPLRCVPPGWNRAGPYFGSIDTCARRTLSSLERSTVGAPLKIRSTPTLKATSATSLPALSARQLDGLLPVPGDGRYEWDGYFDMDVLPEEYNPKRGFSGTANAMSLPNDYPIDQYKVGFEWSAPGATNACGNS